MNFLSKVAMVLVSCQMAACGGGGGSAASVETPTPSVDPVDKYVGQWIRNCEVIVAATVNPYYPHGLSELEDLSIGKINASEYGTTSVETRYAGTDCSGAAISQTTTLGAAQIHGTKTVAFGVVDKVIIVRNGVALKLISQVAGGRLYVTGATRAGITLDAEGYPDEIVPMSFATPKTP